MVFQPNAATSRQESYFPLVVLYHIYGNEIWGHAFSAILILS